MECDQGNGEMLNAVLGDLDELEKGIALADYELLKEQVKRFKSLYEKRDDLVSKIPGFWLRVFEASFDGLMESPNLEDFQLLEHLTSFKVSRDANEPKDVEFVFTFSPNDYLADDSLTLRKKFLDLEGPIPEAKVVSSKVLINWKPGKDLAEPVKGAPPSFFRWFAFENDRDRVEELDCVEIAEQLADEIYPHAHKIFQRAIEDEGEDIDEEEDLEESVDEDEDEEEHPPKKRQKNQ